MRAERAAARLSQDMRAVTRRGRELVAAHPELRGDAAWNAMCKAVSDAATSARVLASVAAPARAEPGDPEQRAEDAREARDAVWGG